MRRETGLKYIGLSMHADLIMNYFDKPPFPCKCLLKMKC